MEMPISEPYFSLILRGVKTVEGKKGTEKWKYLKVGDIITFTNNDRKFNAEVTNINRYYGRYALENYLMTETLEKTLPGIKTIEQARTVYLSHPISWTQEEIEEYGIMAIHVRPL